MYSLLFSVLRSDEFTSAYLSPFPPLGCLLIFNDVRRILNGLNVTGRSRGALKDLSGRKGKGEQGTSSKHLRFRLGKWYLLVSRLLAS